MFKNACCSLCHMAGHRLHFCLTMADEPGHRIQNLLLYMSLPTGQGAAALSSTYCLGRDSSLPRLAGSSAIVSLNEGFAV